MAARALMVLGTGSDAGKSLTVAALWLPLQRTGRPFPSALETRPNLSSAERTRLMTDKNQPTKREQQQ